MKPKKCKDLIGNIAFINYWNIGVVNAPIQSFLKENSFPEVKWFPNLPKDRFFADPFALVDGNKLHIYFEEYPYKERKGKISYMCYENGRFSTPQTVINEAFRLSYPYLLKLGENIYMIPESHEANKIILYKAIDFPLIWKKEHILINNFAGIDSTIFKYQEIWWMFTSDHNHKSRYNQNLFYADNIFDEWKPHPQNPIITDVRSARSAGTPFVDNDELYRPSMDYSEKIQGSITINKVLTITKEIYQEVMCNKVRPYKKSLFPDKIHNLSEAGEYSLIDGCKQAFILTDINFFKFKVCSVCNKFGTKF